MEELEKSSLIKHLDALRALLMELLCAAVIGTLITYALAYEPVQSVALAPLGVFRITPVMIGVTEAFTVRLKLSFFFGLFAALPVVIVMILRFIFPALYKGEKRAAVVISAAGTGLFIAGVVASYRYVLPMALRFFLVEQAQGFSVVLSYDRYFSFFLNFLWPFGLLTELPLVVFILTRANLIRPETLKKGRRCVVVAAFIIGAFLTPPDVVSQIMLALPVLAFYELSIFVSAITRRFMKKNS